MIGAALTHEQRQYLAIGFVLGPALINTVINGVLGWLTFRDVASVSLWGTEAAAGPDTLGTLFFLPLITCFIVTPIVRRQTRNGTVAPADADRVIPAWLRFARRPLLPRALRLGFSTFVLLVAPTLAALLVFAPTEMALWPFLIFKASFSAVLGALVTPLIALVALADPAAVAPVLD